MMSMCGQLCNANAVDGGGATEGWWRYSGAIVGYGHVYSETSHRLSNMAMYIRLPDTDLLQKTLRNIRYYMVLSP